MAGPLEQSLALPCPQFALITIPNGIYIAAIDADTTLDATYPNVVKLDPSGAAKNITLDAISTNSGLSRWIINGADAAENLVVKNAAGSTIGTINQNEAGLFYCNGSAWVLVYVQTIALS